MAAKTAPPAHTAEAEPAVVGGLLLAAAAGETAALDEALAVLHPGDFTSEAYRSIFETIVAIRGVGGIADVVTVCDELRARGLLDRVGGAGHVTGLLSATFSPAMLPHHVALLRRAAAKHAMGELGFLLQQGASNGQDLEALAALTERVLTDVRVHLQTGDRTPLMLTPMPATALCALSDPEPDAELLGPVLTRGGRTVIGAHTGHGKTTLALQIVRAVVTRSAFLGWTGAGGRALVIDAEQGLRTIKRRLREAGLETSEQVDFLRVPDGLSLDKSPAEVAAIEEVLRAGQYAVLFCDPLYKLHTGNSNDEREAVDLMRVFDRWREQHRFALIMTVHTRKPPPLGARFTMHEFFGSGAYLRGAEVVLGLEFLRSGYSRLCFFKDRDGDLPVGERWALLFSREAGFSRDPHDGEQRQTAVDKVRDVLLATPGMTEPQLVAATKYAGRTVRVALKALGAVARRGRDGTKYWSLGAAAAADGELELG